MARDNGRGRGDYRRLLDGDRQGGGRAAQESWRDSTSSRPPSEGFSSSLGDPVVERLNREYAARIKADRAGADLGAKLDAHRVPTFDELMERADKRRAAMQRGMAAASGAAPADAHPTTPADLDGARTMDAQQGARGSDQTTASPVAAANGYARTEKSPPSSFDSSADGHQIAGQLGVRAKESMLSRMIAAARRFGGRRTKVVNVLTGAVRWEEARQGRSELLTVERETGVDGRLRYYAGEPDKPKQAPAPVTGMQLTKG